MAYKLTATRKNIIEGDELTPEASAIFEAYRANGRILGVKTTPLAEGGDTFDMWFESEETYAAYRDDIQAIGGFRNNGVVVEAVEKVDGLEFPGADAMDVEPVIEEDDAE